MKQIPLLASLLLVFIASNVACQAEPVRAQGLSIELIAENETIVPGEPFTVGLSYKIDPKWHTFWINPGQAGEATEMEWNLPEGFKVSALKYPTPHTFTASGSIGVGYENSAVLLAEIIPPDDLEIGSSVKIAGNAKWQVCADFCTQGDADLSLELVVAESAKASANGLAITTAKAELAKSVDWPISAEIDLEAKTAVFSIEHGGKITATEGLQFFNSQYVPYASMVDFNTPITFELAGDVLKISASVSKSYKGEVPEFIEGMLVSESGFADDLGHSIWLTNDPNAASSAAPQSAAAPVGAPEEHSFWKVLIYAFIGGLILNIMPCVFPVISLKVLSFVQQGGEDRRKVAMHGFVFAAGILVFFWIVLAVLLGVRSVFGVTAGGWGTQFQDPLFVTLMAFLILVIALNLFGVFEIGGGLTGVGGKLTESSGYAGSFWSGALAVVLATPCTAPFMGSAIAYALNAPVISAFAVFTMMGIGMSSLYVILSVIPGLINRLPKPGMWMVKFKQFMGFPMIAVVLWLVFIAVHLLDTTGIALFFVGLTLLSIGTWWFGSFNTPINGARARIIAKVATVALLGGGVWAAVASANYPKPHKFQNVEAEIAQLQSEGKHVFVDFTALWCAQCQTNKIAMHSEEVEAAFKENNVTFLEVDWTTKDPEILRVLQKYGAEGIPFYLQFDADSTKPPTVLPAALTNGVILEYLEKLK
jgi:thiol:disulfide interchange protein